MATVSARVNSQTPSIGYIKINDRPQAWEDEITCYVGDTVRLEAIVANEQYCVFREWSDHSEDKVRNIVVTGDLSLSATIEPSV